MQRRHLQLYSPAIGRDMNVLIFGHMGAPVIAFPTYGTEFTDYEDHSMVNTLAHLIDNAKIKLYCVESIDRESWLHQRLDPHWRAVRHEAFEDFMMGIVVPFVRQDCQDENLRIALLGADLGAFHAINFALKFPDVFHYALGLSGLYDADGICGRKADSLDYYYNNPMAYVPNLSGDDLEHVRRHTHLTLVCGQGNWDEHSLDDTKRLASLLEEKGISYERDLWGFDVTPDWHWWNKQADYHLTRTLAGS